MSNITFERQKELKNRRVIAARRWNQTGFQHQLHRGWIQTSAVQHVTGSTPGKVWRTVNLRLSADSQRVHMISHEWYVGGKTRKGKVVFHPNKKKNWISYDVKILSWRGEIKLKMIKTAERPQISNKFWIQKILWKMLQAQEQSSSPPSWWGKSRTVLELHSKTELQRSAEQLKQLRVDSKQGEWRLVLKVKVWRVQVCRVDLHIQPKHIYKCSCEQQNWGGTSTGNTHCLHHRRTDRTGSGPGQDRVSTDVLPQSLQTETEVSSSVFRVDYCLRLPRATGPLKHSPSQDPPPLIFYIN